MACNSGSDKRLLKNWKSYNVPDVIHKKNSSLVHWVVFLKNNEVHVIHDEDYNRQIKLPFNSDLPSFRRKLSIIKVFDGYLVGVYRGEWGGSLYWYSKDGKKHYKISDDEVIQFVQRNNKLYAIEGLDHMGFSKGSILKLNMLNGKWVAKRHIKLPEAPTAITVDNENNFIVVTFDGLLKIDGKTAIKTLIKTGFLSRYYSNSIVIKDDKAFIGAENGVFGYNLKSGNQEWFLEN